MPSYSPRHQILKATRMTSANESGSNRIWFVSDADEPSIDIDYASGPLSEPRSIKGSNSHLLIATASQPDPHERYISSEEEPSPGPDSDIASISDDNDADERMPVQQEESEVHFEENHEQHTEDFKAEVAVAVPIMAMGRPKLIDITSLAPMHKRKRSDSDKMPMSRTVAKNTVGQAATMPKDTAPLSTVAPNAMNNQSDPTETTKKLRAPGSWPDEEENDSVAEEDKGYYRDCCMRSLSSDLAPIISRPKLSPNNSYAAPPKRPGSVARARKLARNASTNSTPALRSLSKPSLPVRAPEMTKPIRQLNKKPKMLPRGPTERSGSLLVPPSPV